MNLLTYVRTNTFELIKCTVEAPVLLGCYYVLMYILYCKIWWNIFFILRRLSWNIVLYGEYESFSYKKVHSTKFHNTKCKKPHQ
jgi:hypothetical protein